MRWCVQPRVGVLPVGCTVGASKQVELHTGCCTAAQQSLSSALPHPTLSSHPSHPGRSAASWSCA